MDLNLLVKLTGFKWDLEASKVLKPFIKIGSGMEKTGPDEYPYEDKAGIGPQSYIWQLPCQWARAELWTTHHMSDVSWGGTWGGRKAGGWGGSLEISQRMPVCLSLQHCTDSSAYRTAWFFVQSRALFSLHLPVLP